MAIYCSSHERAQYEETGYWRALPEMVPSVTFKTRIYNDMVEKTRTSYLSNVKQAKSQVIEISAAVVCALVVVLALIGIS